MSRILITTDTHFGHQMLIDNEYRPKDFEKRIFKGLEVLKENDTLIFLGDFCMNKEQYWHDSFNLHTKKCRKILVRGNHDNKSDTWYYRNGWDFVCKYFIGRYFGKRIIFSHKPVDKVLDCDYNLHGHFHNNFDNLRSNYKEFYKFSYDIDYHKVIYLEDTNYKLFNLESLIREYEED